MRKLYEFFKVLQFQKRIVAAATIWGNTVVIATKDQRFFLAKPGLHYSNEKVNEIGSERTNL
jgi:hypothetical protein